MCVCVAVLVETFFLNFFIFNLFTINGSVVVVLSFFFFWHLSITHTHIHRNKLNKNGHRLNRIFFLVLMMRKQKKKKMKKTTTTCVGRCWLIDWLISGFFSELLIFFFVSFWRREKKYHNCGGSGWDTFVFCIPANLIRQRQKKLDDQISFAIVGWLFDETLLLFLLFIYSIHTRKKTTTGQPVFHMHHIYIYTNIIHHYHTNTRTHTHATNEWIN